jgi:hypothetical protein
MIMTAYNIVRFKVKPGQDKAFLDAHKKLEGFAGMETAAIVKTGEHNYCLVAKWTSFDKIVAARPNMIGLLDSFRHMLEDQGNGIGLTDAVSGEAVLEWAKK